MINLKVVNSLNAIEILPRQKRKYTFTTFKKVKYKVATVTEILVSYFKDFGGSLVSTKSIENRVKEYLDNRSTTRWNV